MFAWFKKLFAEKRALTASSFGYPTMPVLSGVNVSEHTALQVSAVWRACTVIGSALSSLPLILYQRTSNGRERATRHPVYSLLHDSPNPLQTSAVFRETLMFHCLLWNGCYAEIERDGAGRPRALWIIPPNTVRVIIENNTIKYEVRNGAETVKLASEDVVSVPGLSWDGHVGLQLIHYARQSIGLTLAAELTGASFFGNAARPSLICEYPGQLTDPARDNLQKSWAQMYSGVANTGKILVLEEGMQAEKWSHTAEEAQYIETRQYQIAEIARWFGVSPIRLFELGRATWGNWEQEELSFYQDTVRPWANKFEQEFSRKLLTTQERQAYYVEHLFDALMRTQAEARYNVYEKAINAGIMSINEVRQREGLNNIGPEGDKYGKPTTEQPTTEDNGDSLQQSRFAPSSNGRK